MTDPLDALRVPAVPADPDPAFATRLRARLERALDLPRGVTVSSSAPTPVRPATPAPAPASFRYRHGDTAYVSLWVPDVARAAAFFGAVLGWSAVGSGPGLQVPGTTPPQGMWTADGPPSVFCCYAVDDLAAALRRVTAGGGFAGDATVEPYGTVAMCRDDQGAVFALLEVPPGDADSGVGAPPQHGLRPGDVAYLSMETPDSAAARAFYGSVLGWEFSGGNASDGWNVEGAAPMTGLGGGATRPAVRPMYLVDDIAAAVERIRDAGGTSTEPATRPYGLEADCTDDQGTRFYLGQL